MVIKCLQKEIMTDYNFKVDIKSKNDNKMIVYSQGGVR